MKLAKLKHGVVIEHQLADSAVIYQAIKGEILLSDFDPTIDVQLELYEHIEDIQLDCGRKVIVSPYDLNMNLGLIKLACKGDLGICAQLPTIEFIRSIVGNDVLCVPYPVNYHSPVDCLKLVDLGLNEINALVDDETDVMYMTKLQEAVSNVPLSVNAGVAIWIRAENPVDSMPNTLLDQIIKMIDSPIYLLGAHANVDGVHNYTGMFHDYVSILAFAQAMDAIISVDSWFGRFAADMGIPTVLIQGSNCDPVEGAVVVSHGKRCDDCKKGCGYDICKRVIRLKAEDIVSSLNHSMQVT